MKINISKEIGLIEVGKLVYGTFVTGAPGQPESVYQKVNKRKLGVGLNLKFPDNSSVLFNIKTGALRAIPGDSLVSVYDAELNLRMTPNVLCYLKDEYKFEQS